MSEYEGDEDLAAEDIAEDDEEERALDEAEEGDEGDAADEGEQEEHEEEEEEGPYVVNVRDVPCEEDHDIEVPDENMMTVQHIKEAFAMRCRRELRRDMHLRFAAEEGAPPEMPLDERTLLRDLQARKRPYFHFTSEPFEIMLREKAPRETKQDYIDTHLTVADHYTIRQLKELYSQTPGRDPLLEADKLMFGPEELESDKKVYQYRIAPERGMIIVARMDFSETVVRYMCGDCGRDVLLKKEDQPRCRECGYRILYKRRTAMPCQYQAR